MPSAVDIARVIDRMRPQRIRRRHIAGHPGAGHGDNGAPGAVAGEKPFCDWLNVG